MQKSKRSKSETLLTLNSLLLMGTTGIGVSGINPALLVSNSSKQNNKECKNKHGLFLDVTNCPKSASNSNLTENRRFSFRSLFKSSKNSMNKQVLEIPTKFTNSNSNLSLSNSSSFTTNSKPVASATGSVLKFHSFKFKQPDSAHDSTPSELNNSKALSDPTVNRLNLNLTPESSFKLIKKSSTDKNEDENDIDQIFNEYLTHNNVVNITSSKNSTNKKTSTSTTTSTSSKARSYKNIFNFLFKNKPLQDDVDQEEVVDLSRHRRSRTLDAVAKSKLKFFQRKKNSLINSNNLECNLESDIDEDFRNFSREPSPFRAENDEFCLNNLDLFQIEKNLRKKQDEIIL